MKNDIDTILFDFGGVFTTAPFPAVDRWGQSLGLGPGEMLDLCFGPYHMDGDHPWHRAERGELGLDALGDEVEAMARERGFDFDFFDLFAQLGSDGGFRQDVLDHARGLRARGFRTGIITNNFEEIRETWRSLISVEENFDVVIDSSEVGVRKPNPEIYRLALEALGGLSPERAVFLDDIESNVSAAALVGMRGIVVPEDYPRALRELDALLGL